MNYTRTKFLLLAVICAQAILFAATSFGQGAGPKIPAEKTRLAEIVNARRQLGGFVLLTPADLAGATPDELRSLLAGGPCDTAAPINYGQTINGSLTSQDCRLDDGSYADFYQFQGTSNDRIVLDLTSSAFDAYLGLALLDSTFVVEDDDSGGGTNARISIVLPLSGTYIILANSVFANSFGNYALSLRLEPPCTYSLQPIGVEVPGAGGTFTFNVITPPYCSWTAQSNNHPDLSINPNNGNGSGTGNGTVTYSVTVNGTGTTRTLRATVANQTFTVTQPSIDCSFSVSPLSIDMPGAATSGQFEVTATPGCTWSAASSDNNFIGISSPNPRVGSGTVNFFVLANNGPDQRTGTITAAGQTVTVRQVGLNCSYSVSPGEIWHNSSPGSGLLTINTQASCTWFIWSNSHVVFPGGPARIGPGTIQYSISVNPTYGPLLITNEFNGHGVVTLPIRFHQTGLASRLRFNYDDDIGSDISVFRPSDNSWYLLRSTGGYMAMSWGEAGDRPAPADYDGDGKTDIAVFRPSEGIWYVVMSQSQTFQAYSWGVAGDQPVPADHNGDGKVDLVVYRDSDNTFYKFSTVTGPFAAVQFGIAGDKPQIGDFDADGRSDVAVYRPSDNYWYVLRASGGFSAQQWGEAGDIPVPADYDRDGKTDIAVFRPSEGIWYRIRSMAGFDAVSWGQPGDIPVPADFDADGRADPAVFRPAEGVWYLNRSTAGFAAVQFGQNGDVPTQSAFVY